MRNPNFLKAALTTRGKRATKRNLRVELYDQLGRASLTKHETGGTKSPKGAALAVPTAAVRSRRGSKGVPRGLRPKNLPNSFRMGDAVYQRTGKGKNKKLRLMYVLKPSAQISPRVPFHRNFETIMRREVRRAFGPRLEAAMKTAIRR